MKTSSKTIFVLALAAAGAGAACTDFLRGPGLTDNPNSPVTVTPTQQLIAMQSNMATVLEGQLARCARQQQPAAHVLHAISRERRGHLGSDGVVLYGRRPGGDAQHRSLG